MNGNSVESLPGRSRSPGGGKLTGHRFRVFPVAAIVLGIGILFHPTQARCDIPGISVVPTSNPTVEEFDSGEVTFVITNLSGVNETINSITVPDPGIAYFAGDPLDQVSDTAVVVVPFPCMFVLHPISDAGFAHSCTFVQTFDTQDIFIPLSGNNQGQYYIFNDVDYSVNAVHFAASGRALVTITDPVPEPGSIGLLSLAVGLAFLCSKRRYKFNVRPHGLLVGRHPPPVVGFD